MSFVLTKKPGVLVKCTAPSLVKTGLLNIPKPYEITADLGDAEDVDETYLVDGHPVITANSYIPTCKGSESGNKNGGVKSNTNGGKCFPKKVKGSNIFVTGGHEVMTTDDLWAMDGEDVDSCNTVGEVSEGSNLEIAHRDEEGNEGDHRYNEHFKVMWGGDGGFAKPVAANQSYRIKDGHGQILAQGSTDNQGLTAVVSHDAPIDIICDILGSPARVIASCESMTSLASYTEPEGFVIHVCDLNVTPAPKEVIGFCTYYHRPGPDDPLIKKTGVTVTEIVTTAGEKLELIKTGLWRSFTLSMEWYNFYEDHDLMARILRDRDKLITADSASPDWTRVNNFLARHQGCGHKPPPYYVTYGYYYCSNYSAKLAPKLSPQGRKWLERTRINLQQNMEDGLKANMSRNVIFIECKRDHGWDFTMACPKKQLEIDPQKFKDFAFGTHPPSYIDAGLADLPAEDWLKIAGQPNVEEWAEYATWKQAAQTGLSVGSEKVEGAAKAAGISAEYCLQKLISFLQ